MTTIPLPARPVALRSLALPAEHGGWGFLLEPIALGLLVAPSWSGAMIAVAAVFVFLARHPLKLALQDAVRRRSYPRTPYCRMLAAIYLLAALLPLAPCSARVWIPFAVVAPFALVQLIYDARNRSRELVAELSGALAMSSIATAIAIAGGRSIAMSFTLAAIIAARSLPSILYVRALLRRAPAWPAIAAHALAVALVALIASPFAIAAMIILLLRAIHGVAQPFQPAPQTIGWREIAYGAVTVTLVTISCIT